MLISFCIRFRLVLLDGIFVVDEVFSSSSISSAIVVDIFFVKGISFLICKILLKFIEQFWRMGGHSQLYNTATHKNDRRLRMMRARKHLDFL